MTKIKVIATAAYKELNLKDAELNRIPEKGETFYCPEERIDMLLGNNKYKKTFIKVVIEEEDNNKKEIKNSAYTKSNRTKNNVKKATIQK